MSKPSPSPWSAYGRSQNKADRAVQHDGIDPTFGAEREAMRTHEALKRYLERTMHEYNEIRAGRTGYARIVAQALERPPRPESIEETLRRLSGALSKGRSDRSDPSSTV